VHPTEWKNSLSMLEFTHNNQRHADQIHTSFELMNGKAPITISMTFENTKFPSVAEKIKNLVTSVTIFLFGFTLTLPFLIFDYLISLNPGHLAIYRYDSSPL
jgi:hypothetical protein